MVPALIVLSLTLASLNPTLSPQTSSTPTPAPTVSHSEATQATDNPTEPQEPVNVTLTITVERTGEGIVVDAQPTREDLEYRWLVYDLAKQTWGLIRDWQAPTRTLWEENRPGAYWIRVEARTRESQIPVGDQTIGYHIEEREPARISATNASWTQTSDGGNAVLLGMTGTNVGHFEEKIYDVSRGTWIAGFTGAWNTWQPPHEGVYWTHFEAYDRAGKLTDTRTYTFGIGVNDKLTGTAIMNAPSGGIYLGASIENPIGSTRTLIYDVTQGSWIQGFTDRWVTWKPPHYGAYWVTFQALRANGDLAEEKTFVYGHYPKGYNPSYPPVFVYGTLRPGAPASFILPSHTSAETTRVPGYDLWVTNKITAYATTLPYAIPNTHNKNGIVGNMIVFPPENYTQALDRLDRYEGINVMIPETKQSYQRILTTTREGLSVWIYQPRPWKIPSIYTNGWKIASGDYLK